MKVFYENLFKLLRDLESKLTCADTSNLGKNLCVRSDCMKCRVRRMIHEAEGSLRYCERYLGGPLRNENLAPEPFHLDGNKRVPMRIQLDVCSTWEPSSVHWEIEREILAKRYTYQTLFTEWSGTPDIKI